MIYIKLSFQPPEGSAGCANACFVRIRKGKEGDKGLLAHELKHVEQFWNDPIAHSYRYRFDKHYRLDCEVEAYRVQLYTPHPRLSIEDRREMYATWLSDPSSVTGYGLTLTKKEALRLLS
jgi:hypothetical protein